MKWHTAKDVMTRNVLTVPSDWPLEQLAEYLVEHGISGAPVVSDEGKLVGVVSLTDIVRHNSVPEHTPDTHNYYRLSLEHQYASEELAAFRIAGNREVTVGDVMTPAVYDVNEYASVKEVAEIMLRGQLHRLFVTRDGEVVGVVSAMDLLKVVRDM